VSEEQRPFPAAPSPQPQAAPQAVPAAPQSAHVQGERNVSAVAGQGGFTKKRGAVLVLAATGAAIAFILLRPQGQHPEDTAAARSQNDKLQVHQFRSYEGPPLPSATPAAFAEPHVAPPALPPQGGNPALSFLTQQAPADPLAKARRAPILAYGGGSSGGGGQQGGQEGGRERGPVTPGAAPPNELAARLQATPIHSVAANVLRNQPYLLTEGTTIPCTLETAMDSTLPGFVTCRIPYDITGKTGITLLDKDTLVKGEFRGGVQQGQNRLFVLWTRAETPKGVIINLDSPATDPLGRSGFDGEVNTHFWQRFGGALLLSLVEGGIQAGTAAVSQRGTTYINTGDVSSVASEALAGSVGIRPTLKKNQGERVAIFVARDLDFSTAYSVSTTASTVAAAQ